MPVAEIITIGTELLLGEIQDTNTRYLTRHFRDIGIDIYRTTSVGDNAERIASMIREAFTRAEIVVTTGGLGPTVDDPTRDAVALAFNTHTDFLPELWKEIEARFHKRNVIPSPNNRRQAYLPHGASVIHNPVGTAPAFYLEFGDKILISLPGVPREMETLTETEVIPLLQSKFHLHGIIKARILHIAGVGESVVDEYLEDFEKLGNPTVGLLAHPGIVDARITAKASSIEEADILIREVEQKILSLFPNEIFGFDDTTLLQATDQAAKLHKREINIFCSSLQGLWPSEFQTTPDLSIHLYESPEEENKFQLTIQDTNSIRVEVKYYQQELECHLEFIIIDQTQTVKEDSVYNGPPAHGPTWAINRVLENIRRHLNQMPKE